MANPHTATAATRAEEDNERHLFRGHLVRETKLVSSSVKDLNGQTIGKVEELVIDKDDGRVAYAVLSFGGFLGVGEKLFALPFSKVTRTNDDAWVVVDLSKAQLEHAPNFTTDAWPTFDRDYGAAVHGYYRTTPYWDATDSVQIPTPISKDALTQERLLTRGMCRASKVIGTDVDDATGRNLGHVDDLVIDESSGRIVYAVLSFGGFLGMGDKLFALPWRSLRRSPRDDDKLLLDIPKERLEAAPGFDKKSWPDLADRRWGGEIHQYYGQEPHWNTTSATSDLAARTR